MDQQFWDDLYSTKDQLWSGAPNGALVAEAADLPPGQALDIGCGEGGDALWLAGRGWLVTAIDISRVALERAAAAAGDAKVSWTHADLTTYTPPAGSFDLVTAMYPALPRSDEKSVRAMLAAVAPGGTLLVVGHDLSDWQADHAAHDHANEHDHGHDHANEHGHEHDAEHRPGPNVDPTAFYRPDELADLLDDSWTVLVNETRPRVSPAPEGTGHINDVVLKSRKQT